MKLANEIASLEVDSYLSRRIRSYLSTSSEAISLVKFVQVWQKSRLDMYKR